MNLKVESDINLFWHDSSVNLIKIRCGRNLLPKIESSIKDSTLILKNGNKCNWVRSYEKPMEIDLYSKAPYLITIEGFGDFTCRDTLRSSPLTIQHYGASKAKILANVGEFYLDFASSNDCEIFGQTSDGIYHIQNYGKVKGQEMKFNTLTVTMKGQNDAWVWAEKVLSGALFTSRNVYLKGNPTNLTELKAGGKVIKM